MLQHARFYAMRQGEPCMRLSAAASINRTMTNTRSQRSPSLSLRNISTSNTAGNGTTSGWRGVIPPTPPDGRHASGMVWVGMAAITVACLTASIVASDVVVADSGAGFAARGEGGADGGGGDAREGNAALVAAAHELRRALTPPHQSLFRVVCILVYEDFSGKLHRITGTNAEPSTIGGSICAERAAMCKLREVRDCKRVTKVVVVSDNPGPLAPGVLCREFLSAYLAPSTPVVMSGAGDEEPSAAGGLLYQENDVPNPAIVKNETDGEISGIISATTDGESCCVNATDGSRGGGGGGSGGGGGGGGGDGGGDGGGSDGGTGSDTMVDAMVDTATVGTSGTTPGSTCECYRSTTTVTHRDSSGEATIIGVAGQPSGHGADGGNGEGRGGSGGGRVDVCTVGELYPWGNFYGVTGRVDQLRLGFVRQQMAEELSKPGLVEALGVGGSAVLEAYDCAWRATENDNRDEVHPIRYAAAAVFSDGSVEITHQLKALEYGATLDPVTLLAPAMGRRAQDGIRTWCVLLVDQFGNLHAPFAQARAFLTEHEFGDTKVVVHGEDGGVVVLKAKELVPRITTSV